jgi:hypothetical protein
MSKEKVVDEKSESLKIKKKPRKLASKKESVTKVDLTKKEEKEDAVQEPVAEEMDVRELPADGEKVGETHSEEEKVAEEGKKEEIGVIQEITGEETRRSSFCRGF